MQRILSWVRRKLGLIPIDDIKGTIQPCPICGGPAKLIEIEYVRYEGESQQPNRYTVECADFVDHGLWCTPGKCYFHGHDSYRGSNLKVFLSPWAAVKHWNEVVVPIGFSAKQAMERFHKNQDKKEI